MKLERELNVIEKLIDIYSKGKRSEALGDQAIRAVYSALNDMTSQLMRNYSNWFTTYSPYHPPKEMRWKEIQLEEELSTAENEMEHHGHRL